MASQLNIARQPFRHLFIVGLLVLFIGSPSALGWVGLSLDDSQAGLLSRLHPSFYLTIPFLISKVMSKGRSDWAPSSGAGVPFVKGGSGLRGSFIAYAVTVLVATVASILGMTQGSLANTATTFVLPIICVVGISSLSPGDLRHVRNILLVFLLFNSLLGICEKMVGFRLFAYTVAGTEKLNDPRPTAWLSHPLDNALITSLVLTYLIFGEVRRRLRASRFLMIIVHALALVSFGGRTAAVVLLGLLIADFLRSLAKTVITGKGVVKMASKGSVIVGTVGVLALLALSGFLDELIGRFQDDGGSADVRWSALALVQGFDFAGNLGGLGDRALRELMYYYGISNVEFSWLLLLLTHGLLVGSALLLSLCLLLAWASKSLAPPVGYMLLVFSIVTFGYTSIGANSLLLAQLAVLVAALVGTNFKYVAVLKPTSQVATT